MTERSPVTFSDDQAEAHDRVSDMLRLSGVNLDDALLTPVADGKSQVMAVIGKAGSGKTLLLAELYRALEDAGVEVISGDWEGKRRKERRTLAILAPTNKAASVLRNRGVPATTIHRILYTPVYDPEYEKIAEWLAGNGDRPEIEGLTDEALDRAFSFYQTQKSIPGALAAAGLRGSDFITGWKRRDDPLDIGFVDESSMLDEKQFEDLREIFPTLVLFGDPAQLAPVGQSGKMIFDDIKGPRKQVLHRIHRQEDDNPILDLAHALADEALDFDGFERMIHQAAARDDRVVVAPRANADLMARSPVLVWRNKTRVRLIQAFRSAFHAPEIELLPGEPLICDGIELPLKHRKKRIDLEARGLIKGRAMCLSGSGEAARILAAACVGGGRPSGLGRVHREDRKTGRGRAVHPLRRPYGGRVPARGCGDDPQGAGLAMARGAGVCPGYCRSGLGRADRGWITAVETLGLCGDHAGRDASALGHALCDGTPAGRAVDRRPARETHRPDTGSTRSTRCLAF